VSVLSLVEQSIDMRMALPAFVQEVGVEQLPALMWPLLLMTLAGYLIGSVPFAYIIVKTVAGEDITEHGTGNVGRDERPPYNRFVGLVRRGDARRRAQGLPSDPRGGHGTAHARRSRAAGRGRRVE
jgi:hypothetical protein